MMTAKSTTITDVARTAGVSISTVSRVLNDSVPVSDELRAKVQAAVEELKYQPNILAQNLRRGATATVGVISPSSSGPFFAEVVRGIENECFRKGRLVYWCNLENDPEHPLYNRVIQGRYPPGSTFKLVAAIAALQEKIITTRRTDVCNGYYKLGRKTIKCWRTKGHGKIRFLKAIESSCNVYFIKLGLDIGIETWAKYSKKFLFGQITGIDLPNETSGLVPTKEYYDKILMVFERNVS